MRLPCLLLLFLPLLGFTQTIQTIPKTVAQEDFLFLKESIKTYQPTLNIYNDSQAFEKLSDSLYQSIGEDLDILQFHQLICRLSAATNEGHFSLGSSEDAFRKGFFDNSFRFLPLVLHFSRDRAVVEANYSGNTAIEKGDEGRI